MKNKLSQNPISMFQLNSFWQSLQATLNIRVRLVDEFGNHIDPLQMREVDYLSRFPHKSVVSKVLRQMVADHRTGTVEIHQDRIEVKEN
jgi:hypothetical protein